MRRLLPVLLLLLSTYSLFSQVTGTVTSGDAPVPDVTVTIKGTQQATTTNNQGKFSINAPERSVLVFTHVNYTPKEITVESAGDIKVQLELLNGGLGEVVVVGYNSQKKATLTGSVSTVKGAELVKS